MEQGFECDHALTCPHIRIAEVTTIIVLRQVCKLELLPSIPSCLVIALTSPAAIPRAILPGRTIALCRHHLRQHRRHRTSE